MSTAQTVYVVIGNSDDKLSQAEWAKYVAMVRDVIRTDAETVHGAWLSAPDSRWQNACWCVEVEPTKAASMKEYLAAMAGHFRQESIAWAEARTEFLTP